MCITEYYSALKNKEILLFVTIRMDLEDITLVKWARKGKTHVIRSHLYRFSQPYENILKMKQHKVKK